MAKTKSSSQTPSSQRASLDTDTQNNLRVLYNHAYDETKHFRTFEWQITVWATTLIGAIISLTKFFTPNPEQLLLFKWVVGSFTVLFAVSSIVHIVHCHRSLTVNRASIWKIEREFRFHELRVGDPLTSLFPAGFSKPPKMARGWFYLFDMDYCNSGDNWLCDQSNLCLVGVATNA